MRVCITGAGGTGTREIAREVSRLFGLRIIDSPTRRVYADLGIQTEREQVAAGEETLTKALRAIFDEAEEDFSTAQDAVQVHSLLDHLAYRLLRARGTLNDTELTDLEHRTLNSVASADIVVFCPFGVVEVEQDGVRQAENVDRIAVDALIRGYIRRFAGQVTVLDLLVPSFRGRVQHVASAMSQLGFDATQGGQRLLGRAQRDGELVIKRLDEGKRIVASGGFRFETAEGFIPTRAWAVPDRAEAPAQLIYSIDDGGSSAPEVEVFAGGEVKLTRLELGFDVQEDRPFVVQVELRKVETAEAAPTRH